MGRHPHPPHPRRSRPLHPSIRRRRTRTSASTQIQTQIQTQKIHQTSQIPLARSTPPFLGGLRVRLCYSPGSPTMTHTITARHLITDIGSVEFPVITLTPEGTIGEIYSDPKSLH